MDCQRCGVRKGQIQVTRLVEGTLKELFLCEECLRAESQMEADVPEAANHMLTAILDAVIQSPLQVNMIKTTSCSQCGMTFGMFREIGKMGCSRCYMTFTERLEPVLEKWHGHKIHTGKKPLGNQNNVVLKSELQLLHRQLKEAIASESFEEAARLRDLILILEAKTDEQV